MTAAAPPPKTKLTRIDCIAHVHRHKTQAPSGSNKQQQQPEHLMAATATTAATAPPTPAAANPTQCRLPPMPLLPISSPRTIHRCKHLRTDARGAWCSRLIGVGGAF
jgi:hypothetical protein